jgi:hypothetical protein
MLSIPLFGNRPCLSDVVSFIPFSPSPFSFLSKKPLLSPLHINMGSATSSIPPEPIVAAAALAGVLSYGYVHFVRPVAHSGDEDAYSDASVGASKATSSTLRGQKKRGRKLQLPGDATLKNLDILDAPVPGSLPVSTSASKTRERQRQVPPPPQREAPAAHAPSRDAVPGGFDGEVAAVDDDVRDAQQEQPQPQVEAQQVQQQQQATKKPKKKKGKKTATAAVPPLGPASAPAVGAPPSSAATPESAADMHDERWTRVEARKKKVAVPQQDGLAELHSAETTAADVTTSDAGVTTSVTGNSSPVTERTTEDELRSEADECVLLFFYSISDWC